MRTLMPCLPPWGLSGPTHQGQHTCPHLTARCPTAKQAPMAPQLLPTPLLPLKGPTRAHTPLLPRAPKGRPTPSHRCLRLPPLRLHFPQSLPQWLPRQQATKRPPHLGPHRMGREPRPQGPTRQPPHPDTSRGRHPPSELGPHQATEAPRRPQAQGPSSRARPPWGLGRCRLRGPQACHPCHHRLRPPLRGRP